MTPLESLLQLRVPLAMFGRLDRVAVAMADTREALAAGRMSRSMVARLALSEGLAGLETRYGVATVLPCRTAPIQDKTPSMTPVAQAKAGPGEAPEPKPAPSPVSDGGKTDVIAPITPVVSDAVTPPKARGRKTAATRVKTAATQEATPTKATEPPEVPTETPTSTPTPTAQPAAPKPETAAIGTVGPWKVRYQASPKGADSPLAERVARFETLEARAEWLVKAKTHPQFKGLVALEPPDPEAVAPEPKPAASRKVKGAKQSPDSKVTRRPQP